ncbi:MAG: PIG-L family deacetylase [Anaerolineales bacterium]|nr:PIG-L family deacetylase [Anaerolineales bacterium]
MTEFPQPERVLVIVAHPDDPEFGAAGTIARWTRAGAKVTYVIVTDGDKGSSEPGMTSAEITHRRQAEQVAAAKAAGVDDVVFLGVRDGEVENSLELRGQIVRQIRLHRPDIIVTHDPTTYIGTHRINHRDHRTVGATTLDAIFPLARDRLNFPEHEQEGLEAHNVLNVFLLFTDQPDYWVDISDTIDVKIAALSEHKSQVGDLEELDERMRERCRQSAENLSFEYAEAFRRITLLR